MIAERIFAKGWQSSSPIIPKNLGSTKIKGRKKIPCLQLDKKMLIPIFPATWKIIFVTMVMGIKGKEMAINWRIFVPICTTSEFFWKKVMVSEAYR